MLRVFHLPSHLTYARKLTGGSFSPVPSPTGKPLRVRDLLQLAAWEFFDLLHLHTVELATHADLLALARRLRREGKGLLFTAHDLVPNIEVDEAAFRTKTVAAAGMASGVVTLTAEAASRLARDLGVEAEVVPHGYAVSPDGVPAHTQEGEGMAMFGALRPNRHFVGVVRAWMLIDPPRPPLRVLLRSLTKEDRRRYSSELAELEKAQSRGAALDVADAVVPDDELVTWCRRARVLVLPYGRITHSGQLELARDLGLPMLAPDVPTIRAQLRGAAEGATHPVEWFPPHTLGDPPAFARHLSRAALRRPASVDNHVTFLRGRQDEHDQIVERMTKMYAAAINEVQKQR